MPEGVAHAPQAITRELLKREDHGRTGATHRLEDRLDAVDAELKDDGRAAERRRRVAVPVPGLLGDGEGRPAKDEVRVADGVFRRVQVS
jgi:hypothetical protein